jgi:DUF4097 and DUF4098 domain-containing protein YvlB
MYMKALLGALTLATALAAAALPAKADDYRYTRTVDTTTAAGGASTLSVTGHNGNIHLYADSTGSVHVHALLKARSADALSLIEVRASRQGNTVRVTEVCPTTRHFFIWSTSDCDVELDVHYPRAMTVALTSQNGNIAVDGARAAVSISNSNGNVHVSESGGAVDVKNKNGNVTVAGATANLSVTNTNGNVEATLASGWRGNAINMHTNAGNVELQVPSNFQATLNAKTRMGDVRNRANLRSGPVTVTATTTFGDVIVTRH